MYWLAPPKPTFYSKIMPKFLAFLPYPVKSILNKA